MLRVTLLLLTLWASTIHAFFPWKPQCDPSDTECVGNKWPTKETVHNAKREPLAAEGVTFELMQRRTPNFAEDPAARAARTAWEAARLSVKYAPAEAPHVSHSEEEQEHHLDLLKRENTFKFSTPAPPTGVHSTGIYQDGTDFSYFIQVNFGTPPKPLFMLLDSGASSTWVYESSCQTEACKNHNSFDPASSKTYKVENRNETIPYGKGSVQSHRGRDTVSVAGMSIDMSFGLVTNASDIFQYFAFDGIVGLSMVPSNASENFIQVLKAHQLLTSHMFSVSLNRNADGPNTGQISFGSIDPSKYTGEISYTPTVRNASGEWAIPLDAVTYGGKAANIPKTRLAYLDTGTTFIFGPPSDVRALHELIPGATTEDKGVNWKVPCNTTGTFALTFSGITYEIDPRDWMPGKGGKDAMCVSNIYGDEVIQNAWLFGDVFLKNVFTVFDADEYRIGLAKTPPPPQLVSSTATTVAGQQPATTGMIAPSPANASSGSSSVAAESSPSPSPTVISPAEQLESNKYVSILCIVGIIAMVA